MKILSIVILVVSVAAIQSASIFVENPGLSDLKSSASEYVYHGSRAYPVSYQYFSSNPGHVQTVYVQQAQEEALPQYHIKPEENDNESEKSEEYVSDNDDEEEPAELKQDQEDEEEDDSFENEEGKAYSEADNSSQGEKGESGYNKEHSYDTAQKGKHDLENHKRQYAANGGHKKNHHDSANKYEAHYDNKKQSNGDSFQESNSHKKGHKTTGFHVVHHKDEYKKDHTFYDEADRKGHFEKHGNFQSKHSKENGGHKEGGSSDAAYQNDMYKKLGHYDNGYSKSADKGHQNVNGNKQYHNVHSQFANEEGRKHGSEYGHHY